ncbi:MAG: amidohydrolase [Clostridioides sp.]|jgi:amidohydrolase|nr:amidohydrolase [Clostridioides sp.]
MEKTSSQCIKQAAAEIQEYLVDFRRDLHRHPELSGNEFRTQKRIIEELEKLGIEYEKAGTTSVVATIHGAKPGKTVMLRGDIDALPITEVADIDFRSENEGVMHACGHDTHATMLLGAVNLLNNMKDELSGTIKFFFQEDEETCNGAQRIIADGFLKGVDMCLGIHNHPSFPIGTCGTSLGYAMAGSDTIFVRFEGVSGHGSTPHLAKDSITPACVFALDLQQIVTKNTDSQDSVVLSVGKIDGGTRNNIIAKHTQLDITMRYFDKETRKIVHEKIVKHAENIADMYDVKVELEFVETALSTYNHPEAVEVFKTASKKILGEDGYSEVTKQMGSEDMSYYLDEVKGLMVFIGSGNTEEGAIYPPHHDKFKVDETMFKYGAALYTQFAVDFLNNK